jgi:hypothetical protein
VPASPQHFSTSTARAGRVISAACFLHADGDETLDQIKVSIDLDALAARVEARMQARSRALLAGRGKPTVEVEDDGGHIVQNHGGRLGPDGRDG